MTKREAKREACFIASLVLRSACGEGMLLDRYPDQADVLRASEGMDELIEELERRGWVDTKRQEQLKGVAP